MIKPVSYLQTDPRWKNHNYSASGEKKTIGAAGCGITCAAMVLATLADKAITPVTTAEWSMAHGYKALNQGTYYSYFAPQGKAYGFEWEKVNPANLRNVKASQARPYHEQALTAINAGHYVICCMGPGNWTSGGHYILWYGAEGNNVLINDPASTRAVKLKAPLARLQSEVKYYFICRAPKAIKTKEDEMVIYATMNDVPAWGKATVKKLMDKKLLTEVNLEHNMLRVLVINDRAGLYD